MSNGGETQRRILYVCGTVGVPDIDRCNGLTKEGFKVTAYQLDGATEYIWDKAVKSNFEIKRAEQDTISTLIGDIIKSDLVIIYGYTKWKAIAISYACALINRIVISVHDSKFNDYRRIIFSDLIKSILISPYKAFLAASDDAKDYLIYLGAKAPIHLYYCAIDTQRVASNSPEPHNLPFKDRHFLMVGRFVPKKNYHVGLSAFEAYRNTGGTRQLTICGYGEMEGELRARVERSPQLRENVSFVRAATTKQVGDAFAKAVALLLPSTEEQFGIVVAEAMAAGIPVIASQSCGACDLFEVGAGGFKVEPNNTQAITMFMHMLGDDERFWRAQRDICRANAKKADVSVFTSAVRAVMVS